MRIFFIGPPSYYRAGPLGLASCQAGRVRQRRARAVFGKLLGFAEFGFPKSHAAAFALLAYHSAWLKNYYPAEFYCALLNAQPMGFYPPHVLTNDAQRHGIEVLPPDVNHSGARCTVEEEAVRIGFAYVQGIGQEAARVLEDEFGIVNVVVKPQLYERYRSLVRAEPFLLVSGELQRRDGTVNVMARSFVPLRRTGDVVPVSRNFGQAQSPEP
jgi:DNA polymerase III alpha subunit